MKEQNTVTFDEELVAARALLEGTGLGVLDAVRLALELKEASGRASKINSLRRIIKLGEEALLRNRATVPVGKLCRFFFHEKKSRWRARTEQDYRMVLRRIGDCYPKFMRQRARSVNEDEIRELIETIFTTAQQRRKARAILHAIFAYAEKCRWVGFNPVAATPIPHVREKEIVPLCLKEIGRLLSAARRCESALCLIPFGLMLWGGIRPREVARLRWGDIDLEENVIRILPYNSKTGGARHVTIHAPLRCLLLEYKYKIKSEEFSRKLIIPPNFDKRWLNVRRNAGWNASGNIWQQDVLRHTFASYHAKHFKNFYLLQQEMGHANSNLLRTRYLSMSGITAESAKKFWHPSIIKFKKDAVLPFVFKLRKFLPALTCDDSNFRCENPLMVVQWSNEQPD